MLGAPPAESCVDAPARDQLYQVVDALEAWPFAIVDDQARHAIGFIELLGAAASAPLRLELGQCALDLAEIDAIAARIRSPVFGVVDARAGDDILDDLG